MLSRITTNFRSKALPLISASKTRLLSLHTSRFTKESKIPLGLLALPTLFAVTGLSVGSDFYESNPKPSMTTISSLNESRYTRLNDFYNNLEHYSEEDYLTDVAKGIANNLCITAAAAVPMVYAFSASPVLVSMALPVIGVSFVTGLSAIHMMHKYEPDITNEGVVDEAARKLWGNLLFASQGTLISPLVFHLLPFVPAGIIITGALTGGIMLAANNPDWGIVPAGSLLQYRGAIYTGILGLIGVGILGLTVPAAASVASIITTFGGLGLFSFKIAFEVQRTKEEYRQGQVDPLNASTRFSLDIINIFIRVLDILARTKSK